MSQFRVEGGRPLNGEIVPQGAKNEALQILSALLLSTERVVVENIPNILDVQRLIELLVKLGVEANNLGGGRWEFNAAQIDIEFLHSAQFAQLSSSLRGSIMLLGPLLARFGYAKMVKPGGDKIGRRRVDTHLLGLIKLGAKLNFNERDSSMELSADRLVGTYILMDEASVTGSANLIMAAVLAKGRTTLYNAACEPYVQQLCVMLNNMGAKIEGIGSNLLTIDGVDHLSGCHHRILPDMIEIGSFIGMAAMTAGEITIKDVEYHQLGMIPSQFEKIGVRVERSGNDLVVPKHNHYRIETFIDGSIMTIADAPWPGLSPDLLSVFLVTAIHAKGALLIHQKMFESRLFFVDKLIDMGAKIILCDPHRATIIGNNRESRLKGTKMVSPDIRAGIALLIAALAAEGESVIDNIDQIDRGYEDIELRLNAIGAKILRV
ncbi:MAG: UDP-N-acetylglucosamine 1-carboxyvinyltransferase [Bacteroidales bacterium]